MSSFILLYYICKVKKISSIVASKSSSTFWHKSMTGKFCRKPSLSPVPFSRNSYRSSSELDINYFVFNVQFEQSASKIVVFDNLLALYWLFLLQFGRFKTKFALRRSTKAEQLPLLVCGHLVELIRFLIVSYLLLQVCLLKQYHPPARSHTGTSAQGAQCGFIHRLILTFQEEQPPPAAFRLFDVIPAIKHPNKSQFDDWKTWAPILTLETCFYLDDLRTLITFLMRHQHSTACMF